MFNVGLDFGFFDNRLYGTVEFFNKTSKDLLYQFPLPSSHGITSIMMNLAKVRNHGVELELGADIIKAGDWLWSANFNISSSRDKILDLAGNDEDVYKRQMTGCFISSQEAILTRKEPLLPQDIHVIPAK